MLIDIGSTTTDIISILDGVPVPKGRTDPERLRSRELVYTGIKRTPLCALLGEQVAAEFFATTLDVYLRLGIIPDDLGDFSTADSRPATSQYAHARLARMLGGDGETISEEKTRALAQEAFARQTIMIGDAIRHVTTGFEAAPKVIISGSGEFLARVVTKTVFPMLPATSLISFRERFGQAISTAACAYAVAVLAKQELRR